MPFYERGEASIYYEERGSGAPLLLIAPGGMNSTIAMWKHAAIDPWTTLTDTFRCVAMDQRNAGSSRGPLEEADPWGAYAADQLGLLDHLGIDRFSVMGCCIGGSYILKLVEQDPRRVVAAVLEQPIGVTGENRHLFENLHRSWGDDLVARGTADASAISRFVAAMWRDDFVVSVDRSVISSCRTPLLVLPGIDDFHPTAVGREIAALAPDAVVVEPWKDTPQQVADATEVVRAFLRDHAGGN